MTTAMCHVNYVHAVMVIMYMIQSVRTLACQRRLLNSGNRKSVLQDYSTRNYLDNHPITYIMRLTLMKRPKASKPSRAVDPKAEALRQQGALHPKPDTVQDERSVTASSSMLVTWCKCVMKCCGVTKSTDKRSPRSQSHSV